MNYQFDPEEMAEHLGLSGWDCTMLCMEDLNEEQGGVADAVLQSLCDSDGLADK